MGAYDKMSDEDLCFQCDRPFDRCLCNKTVKSLSDEELKQELERRVLEKTSKKYKGFFIKTEVYKEGCYCPGPRSFGEAYDYYEDANYASIYNLNGIYVKGFNADTLDQALKLAIQYIDTHTPEEVSKARKQLNDLRKQEQELSNKIKEIQDSICDIAKFLNGM